MKRLLRCTRLLSVAAMLFAVTAGAGASPPAGPFRIGLVTGSAGECGAPSGDTSAGLIAYVAHLARRLARPVEICPVVDASAAARLLAGGGIQFAQLDPIAYQPVAASARPLLTPRAREGFGRVETVVIVRANALDTMSLPPGARVAFAGSAPYESGLLRQTLVDHGLQDSVLGSARVYAGVTPAASGLRDGDIDALVLNSAAWQRLCRPMAEGVKPCADLKEVFRGRPRAENAWVVRRDIDDDTRFRLVGIHVALHLENPAAFSWIAPGAGELEPTESTALDLAVR